MVQKLSNGPRSLRISHNVNGELKIGHHENCNPWPKVVPTAASVGSQTPPSPFSSPIPNHPSAAASDRRRNSDWATANVGWVGVQKMCSPNLFWSNSPLFSKNRFNGCFMGTSLSQQHHPSVVGNGLHNYPPPSPLCWRPFGRLFTLPHSPYNSTKKVFKKSNKDSDSVVF